MSLALRQTLRSRPYPTSSVLARRKLTTSSRRCSEHQPRQHTSHGQFYSDLLPGMIPITLLGSAVYIGLHLLQSHLSHEKYLDEAQARIDQLEAELDTLRTSRSMSSNPGNTDVDPVPKSRFGRFW